MSAYETYLRELMAWAAAHPELATTLAMLVTGAGGTARHYRRTGNLPLHTLPWRAIRRLIYRARRTYFTTPAPAADELVAVDDDLATVRERLGRQSYELEWPLSFHYMGESLNARRYYYDPEREFPHRQLHIRGFDTDDGVLLYAHEEASAVQHPKRHLSSRDMTPASDWVGERYGNPNGLDPRGFQA